MKKILLTTTIVTSLVMSLSSCGHEHSFGKWTILNEATCTEEGEKERVCECGEKETKEIRLKKHDYEERVIRKRTCTEDGEIEKECRVCKETVTEDWAAAGHDYAKATIYGTKFCKVCELPTIQSSNIAHYNGVTYSTRDVPGMDKIPVEPAKYDYICSIAFYCDRLYYSCKEDGTSDYKAAIYSCNLDGSDLKLVYDGTDAATSFTIAGNRLYAYSNGYRPIVAGIDLETDKRVDFDGIIPKDYNIFYIDKDYIYCSNYDKETKYSIYKIRFTTGDIQRIMSNIHDIYEHSYVVSSDGVIYHSDNGCLYYIDNGESKLINQFDNNISLVAAIGDMLYYECGQDNTVSLCSYDLRKNSEETIDSHSAAGGGLYFNW